MSSRKNRRDFLKGAAFSLTGLTLAACAGSPATPATNAPTAPAAEAAPTTAPAVTAEATMPTAAPTPAPASIEGKLVIWAPGDSGTITDWSVDPILQEVEKATGVQIALFKIGWDNYIDRINAAVASGQVADMICCVDHNNKFVINQWVKDGVVTPLDDKLAGLVPNVLTEYKANSQLDEVRIDGHAYYKPVSWETQPWYGSVVHVRKDLLDKYKLQPPETFDQYFDFLRAAKKDNQTGVIFGAGNGLSGVLDSFIGAYGAPGGWVKVDGNWQFFAIQPATKQGLLLFRTMVAEGLVDPVSWELTESPRDKYVAGQGASMIWNGGGHTGRLQNDMTLAGKGAQEWTLPALDAGAGSRGYAGGPPFYGATFVTSMQGNQPEAAAKVLDFLSSETGIKLTVLGIPGKDYTEDGGTITLNAEQRSKDNFPSEAGDTGSHPLATPLTTWIPQKWQDFQLLYGKDQAFKDWYTNQLAGQKKYIIPTYGTLTSTPSLVEFQTTGNELLNRAFLDILKSKDENEATVIFDKFVQDWKGAGGDQVTTEMNEALNKIYPA